MTATETPSKCTHGELWLAPDGVWRCERCTPPHFPGEVRGRRTETEVLTLFDDDDKTWVTAEEWASAADGEAA